MSHVKIHELTEDGTLITQQTKRVSAQPTWDFVHMDAGVAMAEVEALQGLLSTGCYLVETIWLTVRTTASRGYHRCRALAPLLGWG